MGVEEEDTLTEARDDYVKDAFYEILERTLKEIPNQAMTLCENQRSSLQTNNWHP